MFGIKIDKITHFFVGATICLTLGNFSILIGFLSTIIVGVAKEIYDKNIGNEFDLYDFLATVLGGIYGVLILLYFKN